MSAGGLPGLQLLLDDVNNSGTFPYDITAYQRVNANTGYSLTQRGRDDKTSAVSPVTWSATLDNTDGRFTLGSTVGGYGPINVDRQIRQRLRANGVWTNRFTGLARGWPTSWPTGNDLYCECKISATDALDDWGAITLRSVPEEEILLDKPALYYTLGEPAGSTSAVDSSGNGGPTLYEVSALGPDVVFGTATGPGTDGLTAAQFSGPLGKYLATRGGPFASTPCYGIEVAFNTTLGVGSDPQLVATGGLGFILHGGTVLIPLNYAGGNWGGGIAVPDALTHVAALFYDGANLRFYLDGVLISSTLSAPTTVDQPVVVGGAVADSFSGAVAHVALWAGAAPTAARFVQHQVALTTGFAGERSDQRIARLAGYAGNTTGTALDVGLTNIPFLDITGKSVAESIAQVADAEQGVAFVDGSGRAAFHNRQRAALKLTPNLTASTDSDMVDPGNTVNADANQVVNYAEGKRAGDTAAVTHLVSAAAKRRRSSSSEYLVPTDAEVLDRLSWLVSTHAKPVPRVPGLVLNLLGADPAVQAAVMARDIDDRVQITSMPGQSPTGSTADEVIRGYAETLTQTSWQWTANVESWADYEQAAVLNDASYGVLGVTTRLGV